MNAKYIKQLTENDIKEIMEIWVYEENNVEWEIESYELKELNDVLEINIKTTLEVEDYSILSEDNEIYILSDYGMSLYDTNIDDPSETYDERLVEYRQFMLDKFGNDYALDYLLSDLSDSSFSWEHTKEGL